MALVQIPNPFVKRQELKPELLTKPLSDRRDNAFYGGSLTRANLKILDGFSQTRAETCDLEDGILPDKAEFPIFADRNMFKKRVMELQKNDATAHTTERRDTDRRGADRSAAVSTGRFDDENCKTTVKDLGDQRGQLSVGNAGAPEHIRHGVGDASYRIGLRHECKDAPCHDAVRGPCLGRSDRKRNSRPAGASNSGVVDVISKPIEAFPFQPQIVRRLSYDELLEGYHALSGRSSRHERIAAIQLRHEIIRRGGR